MITQMNDMPTNDMPLNDMPCEKSMHDSAPAHCRHGSRGRKVREPPLCPSTPPLPPAPRPQRAIRCTFRLLLASPWPPPPPPEPHLSTAVVGPGRPPIAPAVPQSQDQVFAQHNKFGTFFVPKEFMNTKKSAADATAVAIKQAAKQAAAEQAEAKQKTKKKKKAVLEDKAAVVAEQVVSAGDAVPAEATKEEATVQKSRPASPQ